MCVLSTPDDFEAVSGHKRSIGDSDNATWLQSSTPTEPDKQIFPKNGSWRKIKVLFYFVVELTILGGYGLKRVQADHAERGPHRRPKTGLSCG
ncbi:unnamed protein product [Dibothriocephalus latus]|uniref:Uncharacterized protein n=1 Tax=Dibothriocephalus latus TaxID=60516 RepID=A0A3P7LNA8_DIBLA|nr:unnamed protein product [Dibothriocephalus latus]